MLNNKNLYEKNNFCNNLDEICSCFNLSISNLNKIDSKTIIIVKEIIPLIFNSDFKISLSFDGAINLIWFRDNYTRFFMKILKQNISYNLYLDNIYECEDFIFYGKLPSRALNLILRNF